MPALRSPEDLLATELKEIHSAERQLSRALPGSQRRYKQTVCARCWKSDASRAPF